MAGVLLCWDGSKTLMDSMMGLGEFLCWEEIPGTKTDLGKGHAVREVGCLDHEPKTSGKDYV